MSEQVGCFWVDMTACTYIHTMSTKKQAKNLYAITENCSRIFIRFGVQLQQSMLKGVIKLSSSPDMYIHYLVMVTVHMYKCLLARLRWNGSTKSVQNLGSREDWLTDDLITIRGKLDQTLGENLQVALMHATRLHTCIFSFNLEVCCTTLEDMFWCLQHLLYGTHFLPTSVHAHLMVILSDVIR